MNFRAYKPISVEVSHLKASSRVQLIKPKTPRQIYENFVATGELPHFKEGGISSNIKYPVRCFGDLDDAADFVNNIYSRVVDDETAASKAAADKHAALLKELEEKYKSSKQEVSVTAASSSSGENS